MNWRPYVPASYLPACLPSCPACRLNILEAAIKEERWRYCRIDGSVASAVGGQGRAGLGGGVGVGVGVGAAHWGRG